jgi:hypothetical protein
MLILSVGAWAGECEPTYRRMGLETTEVGPLTITASWVLIGCRAQLDQMSPKELAQAKALLANVVNEQAWGLMVFEKNVALRKTVTSRVNEAIGRAAVGDVLLLLQEIRE